MSITLGLYVRGFFISTTDHSGSG